MGNICSISLSCDALFSVCLSCAIRKATYISELEENVNSLQKELQKLIEERDDVRTRVFLAEQRQMQRLNQVQGWLCRVEAVETEAGELIRDGSQEIEKLCLGGYCSKTCKSSYKYGKKLAEKLQVVAKLRAEGAFEAVAERLPEAAADERPTESIIVGLQSTCDEVWRCLGDEQVGIIGLYGMGGVGKTTLLTQINNRFVVIPHDFDFVIWVVVSKNLRLENIQDAIMKKIGLIDESWTYKCLEEKALVIFKILRKKKFVLLLDDVWERIDLIKLGVPLPKTENSSKVVFTTRSFEICGAMKAQESFRVECLGFEEAWKLFKENLLGDILNNHPEIPEIAKTIVEECGGLPLAVVTVGRAMSCRKTVEEWRYAVHILKSSASKFIGMGTEVYPLLKFSYDSLPNDSIRSCLLYCCLFSEDYRIRKTKLIDYWIDEGLINGYDRSELYNQGFYIIGVLVNACLLREEEERGVCLVKMHDVVRDMILWIAHEIEERGKFLVYAGFRLTKAPEIEKWVGIRRMSLMENKIKNLSEIPSCSDLLTLFLNGNHLKTLKDALFQSMSCLRVLNLSNNENLCKLPSGISKLVSLQHLDLSKTGVKELPRELKALINLKYLNLEYTFYLRTIPLELRSNFSMLRVLRMNHSGFCGQIFRFKLLGERFVEELLCLKQLHVLTITLRSFHALQRILSSIELKRCIQCLSLEFQDEHNVSLNLSSLKDLKHLHTLEMHSISLEKLEIEQAGNIVPKTGFHSLETVRIIHCDKLRDVSSLIFIPYLKFLYINNCHEMEEILSAVKLDEVLRMIGNLEIFANLQFLRLQFLPNLKSIYSRVMPLPYLKEIDVFQCPKLRSLPLGSNNAKEGKIIIKGERRWWKELHWEDEATQNAVLFLH